MVKKIIVFLVSILLVQFSFPTYAQTFQNLEIEQVNAVLPQLTAFISLTDADGNKDSHFSPQKGDISALLNGNEITVTSIKSASEESTVYYYMLDVSTSVSSKILDTVKEAIMQHIESKTEHEKIIVITFGEQIKVALDGNETANEVRGKLDQIKPTEKATRFFDGLDKVLTLSEQDKTLSRKIAIVVSDGADLYEGGATKEEVLNQLNSANISIYSMALPNTIKTGLEAMNNLSRETGGKLYSVDSKKCEEIFNLFREDVKDSLAIEMKADTNIPQSSHGDLTLHILWDGKEWSISDTVLTTQWIPDETEPYVISCDSPYGTKLVVDFSENVNGAETPSHYLITSVDGKETYDILSVSYSETEHSATLLTEKELYNGSYELSFQNIEDVSMEKNSLAEEKFFFEIEESGRGRPLTVIETFCKYWYLFVILLLALTGLTVLAIYFLKVRKKKEIEKEEEKQKKIEEKEKGFLQDIRQEIKKYDKSSQSGESIPLRQEGQTKKVSFVINEYQMPQRTVDVAIGEVFILGRSKTCNLTLNDNSLSRRHCAFRYLNGTLTVEDLHSTNGLNINDIRVNGIYCINDGDVINIGKTKIIVRFNKG